MARVSKKIKNMRAVRAESTWYRDDGLVDPQNWLSCSECNGHGYIIADLGTPYAHREECYRCNGNGGWERHD